MARSLCLEFIGISGLHRGHNTGLDDLNWEVCPGQICGSKVLPRHQSGSLDTIDSHQPARCSVVVDSRVEPFRFDGGDTPTVSGVERRSQLFLSDEVRAGIGTLITEAQTYRVPQCSVTDTRLAKYPGRSLPSKVWMVVQQGIKNARPRRGADR